MPPLPPLEWLRRRPRKPRTATAWPTEPVQLAAGADRLLSDLHAAAGLLAAAPAPSEQPTGIITTTAILTHDEADALRADFTAIVEGAAAASEPLPETFTVGTPALAGGTVPSATYTRWGCRVCDIRYSRCYCGGNR